MTNVWRRGALTAPGGFVPAVIVATVLGSVSPSQIARAGDDPNQAQFARSCGNCHATEPGARQRLGPNLAGVYGRKAGQLEDFNFSAALASADWTWDSESLNKWLENAQAMLPGIRTQHRQADPERRAKIIEYLKTLKAQ